MRKPRRFTQEELQPFQWAPPGGLAYMWGEPPTEAASPRQRIDWPTLFGNSNPVEIEVGFGKGLYLLNSGQANPGTNLFGIEIIRKYQLWATGRIAAKGLPNVRTCCADAKLVLRDFVPPHSTETVHVFFPDPWWKQRHRKRLLMSPEFVALVRQTLKPGGLLHFVTDVKDYYEMVLELMASSPGYEPLSPPEENTPQHDMDYLTNFERKFRKEGRAIYRAKYRTVQGDTAA